MFDEGTINVVDFVHPLLAVRSFSVTDTHENMKSPIPITLQLNTSQCKSGVLISGPNGGGKVKTSFTRSDSFYFTSQLSMYYR